MLDAEEYFHLALHANGVGEIHACLCYLKEALQQQPRHAPAIYLLAAQHAQLGLTARAISGMQAALAIDPQIEMARFQLALLLLDGGQSAEAKRQLVHLEASSDRALRHYTKAFSALADGDRQLAQQHLSQGLAQPSPNTALAASMRVVLARLTGSEASHAESEPSAADEVSGDDAFLRAYRHTAC